MLRQDQYMEIMSRACKDAAADQVELGVEETLAEVTKFNEGGIFQNISEKRLQVKARVINQGKMGVATVKGKLDQAAPKAVALAIQTASRGQAVPKGYGFPVSDAPLSDLPMDQADENYSPGQRAEDLKRAVAGAARKDMGISGSLIMDRTARYVVNTSGLANRAATSRANMNFIAHTKGSQSHAGKAAAKASSLDLDALAEEAARTCIKAENPKACPPGEYTMVLPPNALANLTPFFGMLLFSGQADLEGRCRLSGKIGEQVASELVTVYDDGNDPNGVPLPLDDEGVAKQSITLMQDGVPLGFVHDSLSAAMAGSRTTGHAFPATPAVYGPLTANLFMKPGTQSLEEIIQGVERGILATRLHYVRCLNDKEAMVGGVTSDGTFLIEDGRIKCPVRPMRFVIRLVEGLLAGINAVSCDTHTVIRTAQGPTSVSLFNSAHTIPAVRSKGWRLTGTD